MRSAFGSPGRSGAGAEAATSPGLALDLSLLRDVPDLQARLAFVAIAKEPLGGASVLRVARLDQVDSVLKSHGSEIELVPIPRPGREVDPAMGSRYRAVRWGDRLYLSRVDDCELVEFCREALTPGRPSCSEDPYGSYLRISDRERPRAGLPRLPMRVWAMFLLEVMGLRNEGGTLRLALEALAPRIFRDGRSPIAGRRG